MTNIRIATIADVELVKDMVFKFLETTKYAKHIDEKILFNLIVSFLTSEPNQKIVLIHSDKGMIAGVAAPMMFVGPPVATEIGWWVEPDSRSNGVGEELMDAFEAWGKEIKCKLVAMSSLDEALDKYYESRGYVLHERSYLKEL